MRTALILICALAVASPVTPDAALAQLPAPLRADRFSFPGSLASPGTAASAALAMADRWLADAPFHNPAVPPVALLALSPSLQRMSRQDLRAGNRDFDEQPLFVDAAGLWGGAAGWGVMWSAYASQPVARLEDHAFVRGRIASTEPPAVIQATTSARELRSGIGASVPVGRARIGLAGEWTYRDDAYDEVEQSGSPDAGQRRAEFSGDAFGGAAGARTEFGDGGPGSVTAGVSARFLPELEVSGERTAVLVSGDSRAPIAAARESGWEGGASARVVITPTFHLTAGAGGRTAQHWKGFGVESGRAFEWSVAAAFRDPARPWTVRLGLGQEQQDKVPEPRAGIVGLGFGWTYDTWALDLAILRRSIERPDLPTSFDDRALATYTVRF